MSRAKLTVASGLAVLGFALSVWLVSVGGSMDVALKNTSYVLITR